MQKFEIKVIRDNRTCIVLAEEGKNLLEQLREAGIYISAACGGKGKCGKCKVRMTMGATEATEADCRFLEEAELAAGWRLACLSYPAADCTLEIVSDDESEFEVVAEHREEQQEHGAAAGACAIAVDIGTTTLAIQLVERESKRLLHTVTGINHQRAYGADVISRIQTSNDGKGAELTESIRQDLLRGIGRLLLEYPVEPEQIGAVAIAGNTTMGHLLMGYPCETLGVYPFTPVNIETISLPFEDLFQEQLTQAGEQEICRRIRAEVTLLPGISTYVGADISAGLLSCGFDRLEEPCILIDLGTNGEMAIGNKDRILVTSTAAGPAFEGGNISCGMGSVPGAICKVRIQDNGAEVATIGDKPPVGLCGTGVIETVCELLEQELIDETGMLEEDYFDDGYELARTPEGEPIVFTQKDVREIQLAKSAVRAGVETLMRRYGVTPGEVCHVYLAGGFGYKIDLAKTIAIGMLPEEFAEKTTAVGNSSLGGAVEYLAGPEAGRRLMQIVERSTEIELSSDKDFNQFYTDYMFFE